MPAISQTSKPWYDPGDFRGISCLWTPSSRPVTVVQSQRSQRSQVRHGRGRLFFRDQVCSQAFNLNQCDKNCESRGGYEYIYIYICIYILYIYYIYILYIYYIYIANIRFLLAPHSNSCVWPFCAVYTVFRVFPSAPARRSRTFSWPRRFLSGHSKFRSATIYQARGKDLRN